jgi:hypothetical protein
LAGGSLGLFSGLLEKKKWNLLILGAAIIDRCIFHRFIGLGVDPFHGAGMGNLDYMSLGKRKGRLAPKFNF